MKKGRGFTLLEIVIAIALLAVIITALYSSFFLSQRSVDQTSVTIATLTEVRGLMDVLKRELEAALYEERRPYTVLSIEDRDYYGRQTSRLTLTSLTSPLPGLARIDYSVQEHDGRLILRKGIRSAYQDTPQDNGEDLIDDLDSFTVEARYGDSWVKTWDSSQSKRLPEELRVSIAFRIRNAGDGVQKGPPILLSEVIRPKVGRQL